MGADGGELGIKGKKWPQAIPYITLELIFVRPNRG